MWFNINLVLINLVLIINSLFNIEDTGSLGWLVIWLSRFIFLFRVSVNLSVLLFLRFEWSRSLEFRNGVEWAFHPLFWGGIFHFQYFFNSLYSWGFRFVSFDTCTKGKGLRSVSDLVVERNHVLIFKVCILLQLQLSILNNSISFQLFLGD
jgi:hypothetical protein